MHQGKKREPLFSTTIVNWIQGSILLTKGSKLEKSALKETITKVSSTYINQWKNLCKVG